MNKEISVVSYNINGIRAAMRKGLAEWLQSKDIDVVCLQEIKAQEEQIEAEIKRLNELGYKYCYWYSAQKKGYSGVAILSKIEPSEVVYGMGIEQYDNEGRVLRADIGDLSIFSIYFPSGSSGDVRQAVKMQFLEDIDAYIKKIKKKRKQLLLTGDYNICHKAIDIHDPVRNKKTSGFLPEEREWMDQFFESGFIDTFRFFHKGPHNYSWWSYRANARANNKGWRIDYIAASEKLSDRLLDADIFPEAKHSDHCPIYLKLKNE